MHPRAVFLSFAVLATALPLSAQKASQTGTVSQMVGETTISMTYDRPVARGRVLFGELVEWDAIWTPGANVATWIEFDSDVTFHGQALEAGRYGLWMTPRESGTWEVTLVRDWDTHHGIFPFGEEVLTTNLRTRESSHMEVLAFYFPEVGPDWATLTFHWGTTTLPMRIEIDGPF